VFAPLSPPLERIQKNLKVAFDPDRVFNPGGCTMAVIPAPVAQDMADYYKRRASYYERVYHKPERQADLRAMEAWIRQPFAGRHVLEVACGTGWWTPHAAPTAPAGWPPT
jgi:hypothetical protein